MPKKQVNGIEYSYDFIGNPHNPAIVLIAGYTSGKESWKNLVDLLKDHFYLLIFDNQGMPRTLEEENAPLSVDVMANNIFALYASLGLNKPILMGFALGSMVAQAIAYKFPDHVRYLILLSSTAVWSKKALNICERLCQHRADKDFIGYAALILETCFSEEFKQRINTHEFIEQLANELSDSQELLGQRRQLAAFNGFNSKAWVGKISVTTLILSPKEDIFATPEDGKMLMELMPNASQVILAGGHAILIENPASIDRVIKAFYQKASSSRT